MYISDVHNCGSDDGSPAEEFLAQVRRESIKKEIEALVDDEFERLQEYANEHLCDVAARRAESFLTKVLAGDEDAAMALLGDKLGGGRRRLTGSDEGVAWPEVIHGRLFETNAMELRRKLVEAHADLIRNERIMDLEATVEGLTSQIAKQQAEIYRLRMGR